MTLPVGLSHLVSLTSLQLQHNQLDTLPAHLTSLQQLALLSVSHNWLSGFNNTPHFSQLVATWQQLRVLRLANVSDKRGSLVLPSQLGNCSLLSELCVGHNHDVDWGSLEVLLDKCQVSSRGQLGWHAAAASTLQVATAVWCYCSNLLHCCC